jgi:amidohydrolase
MMNRSGLEDLVALRRALHRAPEVSGEEHQTAARISSLLEQTRPDQLLTHVGGTGVVAVYDGAEPGPTLLFRSELDALPIVESGQMDWRSAVAGKAHLCGHDGHMAIVAGLAQMLGRNRPKRGRVICLFQPAEETGAGAAAMLADPAFASIRPDMSIALHNLPGMPFGHVAMCRGPANFASEGLSITLTGRTSHASQPENGVSPGLVVAQLIHDLPMLPARLDMAQGNTLVTVVHAKLGEPAFGIAPGEAVVMATFRAINDADQARLIDGAEAMARAAAARSGLGIVLSRHDGFAACHNDDKAFALVEAASKDRGMDFAEVKLPFRWSEDFGRFRQIAPTGLFVLGAGEDCAPLHAPDYDFPDALIATGVQLFAAMVSRVLT